MTFEEYIETYKVLWKKWCIAYQEKDWVSAKRLSLSIHMLFESARDRSDFISIIEQTRISVSSSVSTEIARVIVT